MLKCTVNHRNNHATIASLEHPQATEGTSLVLHLRNTILKSRMPKSALEWRVVLKNPTVPSHHASGQRPFDLSTRHTSVVTATHEAHASQPLPLGQCRSVSGDGTKGADETVTAIAPSFPGVFQTCEIVS